MNATAPTNATLQIDMVSDVVCPWCSIGYQRLKKALAEFPDLAVELNFRPFELNPSMPREGQNVNEHIAEKYGADPSSIEQNRARLRAVGEEEGVHFKMDGEGRIYNTFLAHKLLHEAEALGTQEALKVALMQAYFSERMDVSSPEVLVEIASRHGFSKESAEAVLADETVTQQVREEQRSYSNMGISAVPTFIFNGQYSMSGAHDVSTLSNVIKDILSKQEAAVH